MRHLIFWGGMFAMIALVDLGKRQLGLDLYFFAGWIGGMAYDRYARARQ